MPYARRWRRWSVLLDKKPSYRGKSGLPGTSTNGHPRQGGRGTSQTEYRDGAREPSGSGGAKPRGTRRVPKQSAVKRLSGPLRVARLVSYLVLLILTARVVSTAWDAVGAGRAELASRQGADALPLELPSVLKGGQDSHADAALASAVEKAVDPSNGVTAIYVKNLDSGASAAENEDQIFPTASLFKVPILVELLRQQSLGMVDMNTPILLKQKYWADGSGVLQAQIGHTFTVQQLVNYMISVSDNTAALALLDLVGTDNVNLTLQANGLEATRLRIGWPTKDWGGPAGENTTTAREMGTLLEKIATGEILNEKASQQAIQFLSQKQQASWLPDMLPNGIRVAHKSGELTGVRSDAGIVYAPGGAFVAVVLTKDIDDYDKAANTIAGVARDAYDYFKTGER